MYWLVQYAAFLRTWDVNMSFSWKFLESQDWLIPVIKKVVIVFGGWRVDRWMGGQTSVT